MSTKGASNHYGNSRGSSQGHSTKHTGYAWAKDFNKKTLDDHFARHGKQMNTDTIESYVAHAVKFANTVDRENCVSFIDKKDTTYKYNLRTNEFAIITKKGYVITYYKPTDGMDYYKSLKKSREKRRKK